MSRLETMLQPFEAAKEWTEPRIAEGIEKNRKPTLLWKWWTPTVLL